MKKFVSLALAVIMILCLSVPASATEVTEAGDYTAEVTGSYIAGTEGNNTVYCVDIAWEDLEMTYHAAKEAIWDTDNLEYSVVTPAYWEGEGTITVTNRSNIGISATPSYSAADGYNSAGMKFSNEKLRVSTAEFGTEHSGSITVTPTGSLPSMAESKTIGTITLTITQNTDTTAEEAQELWTVGNELRSSYNSFYFEYCDRYGRDFYEDCAELASLRNNFVTCHDGLKLDVEEIEEKGIESVGQENLNRDYKLTLSTYYELKGMLNMFKAQMEAADDN